MNCYSLSCIVLFLPIWASSVLFLLTWNPVLFWFLFPFSKVWRSSSRFIQMKFHLARCRMMATLRAEKWHFPHFTRHNKAFLWPLQLQLCTFKNNDILSGEKILLSSFFANDNQKAARDCGARSPGHRVPQGCGSAQGDAIDKVLPPRKSMMQSENKANIRRFSSTVAKSRFWTRLLRPSLPI